MNTDFAQALAVLIAFLCGLVAGWAMWRLPKLNYTVKQTADPLCTYCKGIGYDASGYACTCVKEKK